MPPAAPAFKLKVKGNKPFRPFSTLEDEDALVRTWRATSKVCADLEDGQRLENLSWRLWGMHSSDLQQSASSKLKSKSKESPLVLHSRRVGEKLNSEKSLPIEQLSPILIPHATSFKIRSRKTESSNIAGPSQIKKKKLWITTLNQDVRMEIDGGNGNDDIDEDMIDYERYSRGQSLSTNPSRASSPGRFEGEELPHPDCAGANGLPGPCKVPGCTAFGQPEPTLSNGALGLDTSAPSSPPLLQKISSDSLKNKSNQSQNSPSSSKKKIEDILQEGSNSSSSQGQTPIPFDELLRQFVASNGGNVSAEDPLGLGSDAFDGEDCPFAAAAVAMSNSPQGEGDGNGDGGNGSSSRSILQLPLCCQQRANASPRNGDTTPTHRCCADEKVKELQGQNSPSRATTASEQLTTDLAKMLRSTNGGTEASSHQQSLNLTSHPNNEATANFGFGFDPRQQLAQWLSQQQRSGSGNAIGGLGSGMPLWPTTAHLMQGQSPMNASTPALNSPGPLSIPGTPLSATSYYQPLPPGCAFASNSSTSMGPPSEPITPSSAGPSSTYSSSNNKGKRRADPFVPVCSQCGTSSTPLWRRDAKRRVVCNKCGLRSAKKANASGSNGTGADGEKGSTKGEDGDGNADEEKEDPPICNNCGTGITSLWRKDEDGLRSCNPCGLWLKHHGFPRPVTKRTDVVRRRMRHYDEPQSPSTRADDGNNNENAHTHSNRSSISVPQDQQGQTPCAISTLSQPPPYPSNQSTMMSQQGSSQGHPMNPSQPVTSSTWAPPPYPQPQGGPGFIRDPAQAAAGAYVYFQATGTWPPGWAQQMQQFQQFQPQQNNQFQQNSQLSQGWNQPQTSLPPHLQLQAQTMPPPAGPGFQQQQSPGSQQSWPYQNDTLSQSIGSINQNHQQTMHNQTSSTSTYNSPNAPAQASQFYSNSASNSPATFHDSPIASPAASISNSVDGGDKKPKSKATKLSGNNAAKSAGGTGRPQRGRPPGGVGIANSKRKRNVAGGETAENDGWKSEVRK